MNDVSQLGEKTKGKTCNSELQLKKTDMEKTEQTLDYFSFQTKKNKMVEGSSFSTS